MYSTSVYLQLAEFTWRQWKKIKQRRHVVGIRNTQGGTERRNPKKKNSYVIRGFTDRSVFLQSTADRYSKVLRRYTTTTRLSYKMATATNVDRHHWSPHVGCVVVNAATLYGASGWLPTSPVSYAHCAWMDNGWRPHTVTIATLEVTRRTNKEATNSSN